MSSTRHYALNAHQLLTNYSFITRSLALSLALFIRNIAAKSSKSGLSYQPACITRQASADARWRARTLTHQCSREVTHPAEGRMYFFSKEQGGEAAFRRVHPACARGRMNSIAVDFPPSLECNLAAFEDIQGGLLCFRLVNGTEIEHLAAVSVSFHREQ